MTRTGLSQVLRIAEFRALWIAETLSVAGDQLARVALAVLVYDRSGSAAWSAVTYALTFLPALLGGLLLGGLADRYPRRTVMVVADVLRTVLLAAMAVPGVPLWLLAGLLVLAVLLAAPHSAAQGALLPAVLPGEQYERGLAVRQITGQAAQIVGFAAGGVAVVALGPTTALALDAATFALSAAVVRFGVNARPRPNGAADRPGARWSREILDGVLVVFRERRRRTLALLAWVVGCYVVPEGLAAPYASDIGAGAGAVGLLMAADPAGSVLGAWLFTRFVPGQLRERLIGVLAMCAGLPLVVCALRPDLWTSVILWALSGMFSAAYLLQAQASFVRLTPDEVRGAALGVVASGVVAAQGVALLLAGPLADLLSSAVVVSISGAAGASLAALMSVLWWRASTGRRVGSVENRPPPAAGSLLGPP